MAAAAALFALALVLTMSHAFAQGRPLKLVAFGDSLTAGYNLPASAAFPAVLEKALRAKGFNVEIANAGVSGDTASAGQQRLDWSVPDGTDGVILELGANDMLRGLPPTVTRTAMTDIMDKLKKRNIPVLIAGMRAAPNLGTQYVGQFESIYKDLADTYQAPLYPFFLDGVTGVNGMTLPDGLHPNVQGVEAIVQRILPDVEAFVTRLQAR